MQYLYYMGSIWQACDALDVRKILHVTIMHKDKIQLQNWLLSKITALQNKINIITYFENLTIVYQKKKKI